MKHILFFLLLIFFFIQSNAARVSGTVTDEHGIPLPYASVLIKGTTRGTTANNEGKYFLDLGAGTYTIVAQYVGYARQEKTVHVTNENMQVNFQLYMQQLTLSNVTVKSGGEDPAYEIMRNAIKKRKEYEAPLDSFTCEAYIKTLIKTRKLPNAIFGQKIDEKQRKEMGVDSSGKGIIYLSESITKIAYKKPDKIKLEVISGKESGSNGFGFNFPSFINFYNNNVNVLTGEFAPRGFVSPVADNALSFYSYHFLGSFFEDGKEINKIQVIPRRKYEPVFSGTINITEGDWRIHSLDLQLTKESQLEILDTLQIKQIHVPVSSEVWRTKDQVIYFTIDLFGFNAVGNFLNVYNKYEINPSFSKKYFNNVIVQYDTSVNKKSKNYWDSIRPVPLEPEEIKDYKVKDSIFKTQRDSAWSKRNIDSLRKMQGRITAGKILWEGFTYSNFNPKKWTTISWKPLLGGLQYNTVEGFVINAEATIRRYFSKPKEQVSFTPHLRYGFSNEHFNAWATVQFEKNPFVSNFINGDNDIAYKKSILSFSGGKRISQFNKDEPILPVSNTMNTLFFNNNFMKIYENYFGEITYNKRTDYGLDYTVNLLYEDRIPLDNTTDFTIIKYSSSKITPNYPVEKISSQFSRHQAFIAGVELQYQPGQKFIQFPHTKIPVGSKYPTFELQYTKGFSNIIGSDVNFDKWQFSVFDKINFKLKGELHFRFSVGGFLNTDSVPIQDYQHFNGNRVPSVFSYDNIFLNAYYYANSTTEGFYTAAHIEHHFNGFLTNKIPLLKTWNLHLVAGSNAIYINSSANYVEFYGGLENIFKLLRADLVVSWQDGKSQYLAFRLGLGGLLGGKISFDK